MDKNHDMQWHVMTGAVIFPVVGLIQFPVSGAALDTSVFRKSKQPIFIMHPRDKGTQRSTFRFHFLTLNPCKLPSVLPDVPRIRREGCAGADYCLRGMTCVSRRVKRLMNYPAARRDQPPDRPRAGGRR